MSDNKPDNNTGATESAYRHHMQSTCPTCGALQNIHDNTQADKEPPRNGDLSFCPECGDFAVYAMKLPGKLRPLKAKERKQVAKDQTCVVLLHQWKQWKQQQTVQ